MQGVERGEIHHLCIPAATRTPAGKENPGGDEIPSSTSRGSYFLAWLHCCARVTGSWGRGVVQTCMSAPSLA